MEEEVDGAGFLQVKLLMQRYQQWGCLTLSPSRLGQGDGWWVGTRIGWAGGQVDGWAGQWGMEDIGQTDPGQRWMTQVERMTRLLHTTRQYMLAGCRHQVA